MLLAVALPSSVVPAAAAELEEWTAIGPPGGTINGIAIDPATPTTVYAATEGGVAKSTNAGATWTPSNTGITSIAARQIVVDPVTPTTLYVSSGTGGVFKSTDAATTWTPKNIGIFNGFTRALTIDPSNPAVLYTKGSGGVAVAKTTNGADTWTSSSTGIPVSFNTIAIAVDPQTPSTVYAAMRSLGVYKSTDGAGGWSASNNGLTDHEVEAMALDPLAPATLYVGTCGVDPNRGVFKSVDGGASWTPASVGLDPQPCVETIVPDPTVAGVVYAGTIDGGTFKSVDGGVTWTPHNTGIAGRRLFTVAIDPTNPANVYGGTLGGGVYKSTDGGASWAQANDGIRAYSVLSVTFDPATPGTIYVGTYSDETTETVFRSTDDGATWTPRGPIPDNQYLVEFGVYGIAVDPGTPTTIYAASDSGIFRTIDGGATWNGPPSFAFMTAVLIDPDDPSTVYTASLDDGISKSVDGGDTWVQMNSGLPDPSVAALVMDPSHPKVLYAGTSSGVYRTANGGGSWVARTTGIGAVSIGALALDPSNPDVLFASTQSASPHLYKTTDAGTNWTATTGPTRVVSIAIDPVRPTTLYAGGVDGVFRSVDGGDSWSSLNFALIDSRVTAVAVDPHQTARIVAATQGASAFRTQTRCITGADCDDDDLCTIDACAIDDPAADGDGCVFQPVVCDPYCHEQPGTCNSSTGLCQYFSPAVADGTPCNDDDPCTFDRCIDGACSGNPTPQVSCHHALRTSFALKDSSTAARDLLTWKWSRGASALVADFANPTQAARYTLCVYDHSGSGGTPNLIMRAAMRSGSCGASPCWTSIGSGYKYRDRDAGGDGFVTGLLKAGISNGARMTLKGKGVNLPLPTLPLTPGVIVQLSKTHGVASDRCWESIHTTAIIRNDTQQFKAKGD